MSPMRLLGRTSIATPIATGRKSGTTKRGTKMKRPQVPVPEGRWDRRITQLNADIVQGHSGLQHLGRKCIGTPATFIVWFRYEGEGFHTFERETLGASRREHLDRRQFHV